MREFWKSFCIALKTSKKSIGISIILSCAILCFFCFQIVQKSQNRDLLLTNDEQKVKEQYELFVEKYETASNRDEFINMNTSILRNYYMLELSKKYGIQYTIDERVDDLNRLASQYIEINWEEAESPVLMESTYELEQKMSLPYSDYIEEKLIEIDTFIEQLQSDFPTSEIHNEAEKLLEQKKVYETLKTENDYANLKTVPVEKALSLLEEIYELPKTEEELVENDIIPLYYQNYQEYLEDFSSSKKLIEQEYETIRCGCCRMRSRRSGRRCRSCPHGRKNRDDRKNLHSGRFGNCRPDQYIPASVRRQRNTGYVRTGGRTDPSFPEIRTRKNPSGLDAQEKCRGRRTAPLRVFAGGHDTCPGRTADGQSGGHLVRHAGCRS